jgi:hypothetical protein
MFWNCKTAWRLSTAAPDMRHERKTRNVHPSIDGRGTSSSDGLDRPSRSIAVRSIVAASWTK